MIEEQTVSVLPVSSSLFGKNTILLFFFLYRRNAWIALLAAALFSLDFYTIYFSNKVYPDSIVCAFTFIAALSLWNAREQAASKPWLYALIFVGALWIAFLAKAAVFYTLPFFFGVFVYDVGKKKTGCFGQTSGRCFFL